jgi:hypothetical protein
MSVAPLQLLPAESVEHQSSTCGAPKAIEGTTPDRHTRRPSSVDDS